MREEPVEIVEVSAWGERVGTVARAPHRGTSTFAFAREWVASGIELAPLHMALRPEPYTFPELSRLTFAGLPALLADALPDAFGTALVNAWMAEQDAAAPTITPLERLAFAADRAMGALEFRPVLRGAREDAPAAVQLADLVLAARRMIVGDPAPDEAGRQALAQLIELGTSAGGAKPKVVVAFNPATAELRSAHAAPTPGFEPWLVKLDGVRGVARDGHSYRPGAPAPSGRIEYAYHLMARAAGVEMAPCRLLAEGPRRHFLTRRFDRTAAGERLHLISLCALAHLDFNLAGTHSYDQYLQTVDVLGLGPDARQQAYRRMVFNVWAVNHDDHTKNFAFVRERHGAWRLAPAFDLTHAYRPESRWTSRHQMAVNGRFSEITREDLLAVGERNEVPGYRDVLGEVGAGVGSWRDFAAAAELDDDTTDRIATDIARFAPG